MKKKLVKPVIAFLLILLAFTFSVGIVDATYTKTWTTVTTGTHGFGDYAYASHTFVASTDTAYFPFYAPWQWHNNVGDTLIAQISIVTSSTDSINVTYTMWYTNNPTASTPLWILAQTLGTDSSVSASTGVGRNFNYGAVSHGGFHPQYRLRAIGNAPAGGKVNRIGTISRVTLIGGS